MTKALKIEETIHELNSYLEEKNFYYIEEDEFEDVNKEILANWDLRVKNAIVEDFLNSFHHLKVDFSQSIFEISTDKGETIYLISLILIDPGTNDSLRVFVRSTVTRNITQLYLDSVYANQEKYIGSSKSLKSIFKKLKLADKDIGYFNPISTRTLFI